jgi:hypothetical protein
MLKKLNEIKNKIIHIYAFIFISILVYIFLSALQQNNIYKKTTNLTYSIVLSQELRTSSEDLTKYARNYVSTKDPI